MPARARVRVRARMCAPTRMCPLHMHAPTYWSRRRREPWLPRMRSLSIDSAWWHRRLVASAQNGWLLKGRKHGSRPVSLITKLPDVRAQIPAGFPFSCETPRGGAGTLAGATAWSQRLDIYIFSGWPLPLTERERNPCVGTERSAVPCSAHLRQGRSQRGPGEGAPPGAPPKASDAWVRSLCGWHAPRRWPGSSSLLEPLVSVTTCPPTCTRVHSPLHTQLS